MTVIDTTVTLTPADLVALRAQNVTGVSRYLAPQAWKRLTPAEAAAYKAAAMDLVGNWESGARDLLTLPTDETRVHAQMAVDQMRADGLPSGCWIYNSGADYDVQSGDWPAIAANLRIIRPIYRVGGYGLGLYSSWDALTWAKRDGLVDGYWQSMSPGYSGGRNARTWPGAHLRQHLPTTIAGISCDPNELLIPAYGQMNHGGAMPDLDTPLGDPAAPWRTERMEELDMEALRNLLVSDPDDPKAPKVSPTSVLGRAIARLTAPAAPAGGGLSDDDRALIAANTAAVAHLSAQLTAAGAVPITGS